MKQKSQSETCSDRSGTDYDMKDDNEVDIDQTDEMSVCEVWVFKLFFAVGRIYTVFDMQASCRMSWLSDYQFSFLYVRSLV
jgi:hypothetical protein